MLERNAARAALADLTETMRHPVRELRTHRARLALVIITLMLTAADWSVRPTVDAYSMMISILHMASIALICLLPRLGACGILAVEIACCFVDTSGGASRLWGTCLASGIIVYVEGTIAMAVACFLANLLMQLSQTRLNEGPHVQGPTMSAGVFLLSCAVIAEITGYGLRQRNDMAQHKDSAYRRSIQQQEDSHTLSLLEYASQLHDSVAGSLASISLTAQQHISEHPDVDAATWNRIDEESRQALTQVHRIIDAMSEGQRTDASRGNDNDLPDDLRALCHDHDRALAEQGLHGHAELHDFGLTVHPDIGRVRMLRSLIDELYANMAKYAVGDTDYQLSVTLCDDYIEIMQTNGIAPMTHPSPGNRGLTVHARRIGQAGGDLSYTIRDAQWICFVHLPLV
ncbi:hypothetical protein BW13_10445 [Bifidobacterium sp. UTCIF-37]|uniref:Uncharacterized protein n=3 Tax=Bifidobacterium callitrichos TaxID=762209 RepID=A0A5M9ZAU1_9BIFI|nr:MULTISPECIES: histidine kinase [Bifidobacterium]KAA8815580.1 hypothetical protein EMB92_10505 [Bifidobacterium callitrichos]KFI55955.1 Signal transduction histidine kinase-like protein [Bifidobacterium callitrichos DSM 23973]TPF85496.1 hypothetical protein BW13_10445 [Bifidobacterium sp. UTCIF-37]TPF87579.1 hypothetical protein BW11_10720 [Bifidobacterium sp. UTCIF-38]